MKMVDSNETLLVIKAQTGDNLAFDELLRKIQGPLFGFILNVARDQHLAENILQNVFWTIYCKIGWLNEPKVFRPWMYRIASRECVKQMKKEKRWQQQVRDDEVLERLQSGETFSLEADLLPEIPRLLSTVSPASRAVLTLHYIEDMSLAETADVLEISIGTVKSRLAYGLSHLRAHLNRRSAQ